MTFKNNLNFTMDLFFIKKKKNIYIFQFLYNLKIFYNVLNTEFV